MQTAQPLATDALRVEPLDSALGAEISGIDLSKSLDAVTSVALQDAFRTYRLLLIRDPNVTPESQAAFARVFGDIQIRQIITSVSAKTSIRNTSPTKETTASWGWVSSNFIATSFFRTTRLRR